MPITGPAPACYRMQYSLGDDTNAYDAGIVSAFGVPGVVHKSTIMTRTEVKRGRREAVPGLPFP